jgi:hypothetical protein
LDVVDSSLPELMEKKKMLDMHTNVATALLDEIKAINCNEYGDMDL